MKTVCLSALLSLYVTLYSTAIPSHSSVSNYDAEKLILQVDELESTIRLLSYMIMKCLVIPSPLVCREQNKRVQEAEELAEESKEQLKLAMERITELESELADIRKVKERNMSGSKGKKSATRKGSKVSESPVKRKAN